MTEIIKTTDNGIEHAMQQLARLFRDFGEKHYGEACSQTEHAISSAAHGQRLGMSENLIIAALLHDVGHFVADQQALPGFDQWGYSDHDSLGANFQASLGFPEAVTEPVRLHVAAKRYLAADGELALSPASQATLKQQGGAMTERETESFRHHPWFEAALQLRQLDDLGKPEKGIDVDLDQWLARTERYLRIGLHH